MRNSELDSILLVNLYFTGCKLQKPIKDYIFNGGTRITFTSAPESGSKVKILFYEGSTADVITKIPLQTIKVGDSLKLDQINGILPQLDRTVIDITASDQVETVAYSDVGISTNSGLLRPVFWTKQTSDLIIDGEPISKNRTYLEPRINPTTRLIKDFLSSDTELYVQNINPDFSILDEVKWIEGNFSALNQSSPLACLFIKPFPVFIEATSIVKSNLDLAKSLASNAIVPVKVLKTPFTSLLENEI